MEYRGPSDAIYFHNVTVVTCGIRSYMARDILPEGVDSIAYVEKITDINPKLLMVYIDDEPWELEDENFAYYSEYEDPENDDGEITIYSNCIVEVSEELGVSWFLGEI